MFFYASFAVFLNRTAIQRTISLALVFAGIIAAVYRFHPVFAPLVFYGSPVTLEFIFGCAIATTYLQGWLDRIPFSASVALLAFGLALLVACASIHGSDDGRERWKGIPAAVIVMAALAINRARPLNNRSLHTLGDATYSIYLTHIFVVMAFRKLWLGAHLPTTGGSVLVYTAASVVVAAVVGIIAYKYVESPLVANAKRLIKFRPSHWFAELRSRVPAPAGMQARSGYVPSLDGMRALSICLVLMAHIVNEHFFLVDLAF